MKLFTIAKETSECYGHGDFGTEQRICKTGDYGSGDFPPLFSNPEKRAALAKQAEEDAKDFSLETTVLETEKAYFHVLGEKSA